MLFRSFGNALNVRQCVRVLERAGADAIQLEDQTMPKKCGHFENKSVISMEEMAGKIKAAADARANRGTSSVEERARSAKFESLRLSRSRIMTQLAAATNPAHRTMLERALKCINDEMAQ